MLTLLKQASPQYHTGGLLYIKSHIRAAVCMLSK